ncbi:hypothetical protein ABZV80_40900 [Streptomyces sp. NPDC005132]|uniref:hypothetical protein n=1 Tax=Streptomyces sp. NPDC005132 TaxID=3154294 RepID=UPI0033BDA40D
MRIYPVGAGSCKVRQVGGRISNPSACRIDGQSIKIVAAVHLSSQGVDPAKEKPAEKPRVKILNCDALQAIWKEWFGFNGARQRYGVIYRSLATGPRTIPTAASHRTLPPLGDGSHRIGRPPSQ